jgi:CRISPR-associated protein Cas5d
MKVERVSYDVITPSAARGILEAILWKPAIRWNITKIEVLNPIKWISMRRNEVGREIHTAVKAKNSGPMGIFVDDEDTRQQRSGLFLKDVKYRIHGYFDFIPVDKRKQNRSASPEFWADAQEKDTQEGKTRTDETEAKYAAMFERRAKKGQCFHRPYLGCREFACSFKLADPENGLPAINETRDLGFMLYDMDYSQDEPAPQFFRALINKGIINVNRKEITIRG